MAGLLTAKETTWMTNVVSSALDQSLPVYRKTTTSDGYGHTSETYPGTPTHTIACNIIRPGATTLQAYAGIIASRRTIILRTMSTTDVLEGDRIVYTSLNWEVQALINAESYTVTKDFIVTVIA